MNYYLSTLYSKGFRKPFLGKQRFVMDLLSITIISEKGNVFSAISKDFTPSEIDPELLNRMLVSFEGKPQLERAASKHKTLVGKINAIQEVAGKTKFEIFQKINDFTADVGVVYGYEPFEDFTLLSSITPTIIFYLRDLKQLADQLSNDLVGGDWDVSEHDKYPVPEKELYLMTSYEKAKWCKLFHEFLKDFKNSRSPNEAK